MVGRRWILYLQAATGSSLFLEESERQEMCSRAVCRGARNRVSYLLEISQHPTSRALQFLIVKLTYVGIGKHFGGQNPDGERKVEAWEPHR